MHIEDGQGYRTPNRGGDHQMFPNNSIIPIIENLLDKIGNFVVTWL